MSHTMPFGKHKGIRIVDLPDDYLDWAYRKMTLDPGPLRNAIHREWALRFQDDEPEEEPPEREAWEPTGSVPASMRAMCNEMITLGLRALAIKHHPDRGGKHEDMVRVNLAAEALRKVVGQ
jgi:hypothetical protein